MSIINKPPEMVKREYELQEAIAVTVEKYATRKQNKGGGAPAHRSRFRDALGRRVSEASARPRAIQIPARQGIQSLPGAPDTRPRRGVEGQSHSVGGGKRFSQEPRSGPKESTTRSRETLVLSGLEENRAQTADLHRRGNFGISFAIRRQP